MMSQQNHNNTHEFFVHSWSLEAESCPTNVPFLGAAVGVGQDQDFNFHLTRTFARGGSRLWIGTNCIKLGLPGKSILGDYFQENVTTRRPFLLLRISFPGRPIFIQLPPGNCSGMGLGGSPPRVPRCAPLTSSTMISRCPYSRRCRLEVLWFRYFSGIGIGVNAMMNIPFSYSKADFD